MSNILPQPVIVDETRAIRLHILVVIATCTALIALALITAVVPSYVQDHAERSAIELTGALTSTTTPREAREALGNAKRRSEALAAIATAQNPNKAVVQALSALPNTLSVTSIRYEFGSKGGSLTLTGTAKNRQDILDFVGRLKAQPLFSDATIPVSSLTSSSAGKFDIVVTGAF